MTKKTITASPPATSANRPSGPKPIRPEYSAQWNDRIASTAIPRRPSNSGNRGLPGGGASAGDGASGRAGDGASGSAGAGRAADVPSSLDADPGIRAAV